MADAVVALLVENLNFLLKPEVALAKNSSDDVRFIIDKFKSMQDVLKNADEKSEIQKAVKEWVTQLRHVAFEIEDLLDEYMIQYHKQQSPVKGHGTCASIHKIKQLFNKYLVRRRLRNLDRQIHNIKVQMENIESAESIMHRCAAAAAESIMHKSEAAESIMPKSEAAESIMLKSAAAESESTEILTVDQTSEENSEGGRARIAKWNEGYSPSTSQYVLNTSRRGRRISTSSRGGRRVLASLDSSPVSLSHPESIMLKSAAAESIKLKSAAESAESIMRKSAESIDFMTAETSTVHDPRNDVLVGIDEPREQLFLCCSEETSEGWDRDPLFPVGYAEWNADMHPEGDGGFPPPPSLVSLPVRISDLEKTLSGAGLKNCLLYLCLFPENYVIKCSRLLRLWVAEGFIKADNLSQAPEDVAKSFLKDLIAMRLIQEQDIDVSGRVRTCYINGHVHASILGKAREEDFADFFMNWSPDMKPKTDEVRRLSIFINEDVEEYNLTKGKWTLSKNVRSFFAYGDSSLFNSSTISIFLSGGRIPPLKVLDLEGTHLSEFPGEALSSLSSLKYLGLNSERISHSSSLGKLVNLETLVLKGSLLFQLPVEILHLKRLRNLIGDFLQLPKEVGQLTTLEKLCTVVGYDGIHEELGKLTQLRSLDILLKKDKNDYKKSVEKMKQLRSLRLRMSDPKENTLVVENNTSLPPVERITLIGLMKDTPRGILKLTKLTKLRLAFSALQDDDGSFFEGLQKLSDLRELVLEINAINVEELHFRHEGFSNLRTLKLHGLEKLKRIEVEEGAMPLIRHICFCDCQQLENVPVGIEHLTTLKHVDWFGMPTRLENEAKNFCWGDGHSLNVNQSFDKFSLAD